MEKNGQLRLGFFLFWVGAAGLLCSGPGSMGATNEPSATNRVFTGSQGTNATAIPLAEVAAQAEATFASLRSIEDTLTTDPATAAIEEQLPILTREAGSRREETLTLLSSSPSLEMLRHLGREWQGFRDELAQWKHSLSKRVAQLDQEREHLAQSQRTWETTLSSGPESKMPSAVLEQVERTLAAIKQTQERADAQEALLLTLQTRAAEQDGQAVRQITSIEQAREAFLRRLLVREIPPIWSVELWSDSAGNLARQSHQSFLRQSQALGGYLERSQSRLALQACLFLGLLLGLLGAGRRLRRLGGESPMIFNAPVATALVLSLLASSWIYPQAPRLLWSILGAAALIPTTLLARKLIDRRLYPVLSALVVFYFVDQLRVIAASQALLSRALLLAEMLGGLLLTTWLLGAARFGAAPPPGARAWRAMGVGCRVAFAIFAAAALTVSLGYVSLGKLLAHALLQSAYMALTLYAAMQIFEGLFVSAMSIPPLSQSGLVERHRGLLQSRVRGALGWTAMGLWTAYVLEVLSLRAPLFQNLQEVLSATRGVGSFKFSLGQIGALGLTVWAAFFISRVLRFVLEEEVYPRVELAPGLHYTISKMVNYAVLVLGFLLGVALLGFDLTRLTILVGAFGVGLGFGLQNIINNFVSGIILLFERPIKVGDLVQVGASEGVVKRIGIRASIVRVTNGADLIVPNGSLISETVTNWTFLDRLRRVDLPLSIGRPAEAGEVMALLRQEAANHPLVLAEPPPQVLLMSFAEGAMNFELRFWTSQSEDWCKIRSELAVAICAALSEHKISVK